MRAMFTAMIAALAALPAAAGEQSPDMKQARSLAATCSNCHGTGDAPDKTIVPLNLLPEAAIVSAMQDFKTGKRTGTVMPQLAKGYTDAQIAAIAAWYTSSKP